MIFLPNPFNLIEYEQDVIQTKSFMSKSNPLKSINLETLISRINSNMGDELNRKGILAELIANDLILEHMDKYFYNENPFYEGTLIGGRENYIINSNKKYIAKLITENRILILRKDKDNCDYDKFGFKNIAEIDGLYMIKKIQSDKTKKKEKKLIVIETKSSEVKLNSDHISQDIILPLQKMYNMPISYLVVGFKEDLYIDDQLNILSNPLKRIYYNLKNNGIDFNVIHFPFKKEDFNTFALKLEHLRTGIITVKAKYNSKTSKIELIYPDGKILTGNFILSR